MFPIFAGPHGQHRRSPSRIPRIFAAVVGLGLAAMPSAPAAGPRGSTALSDVALARSALAVVDGDPQLRDVNLVVSVVDRVAVIGGPVPTVEVGKRAEWLVRTRVEGIAAVNNRCFVQASPDPLIRAMADRPPAAQRPQRFDLPGVIPRELHAAEGESLSAPIEGGLALADTVARPVVVRRPASPSENVLFAPIPIAGGSVDRRPAAPTEAAFAYSASQPAFGRTFDPVPASVLTATPPSATVSKLPTHIHSAIEAVRTSDPRFSGMRVELHEGTLVLAGAAARASDAWVLAQAIRGIPGIARVALGQVEVK